MRDMQISIFAFGESLFCPPPWRSHWGDIEMLGVHVCVRASVRHKACERDNFRFPSPIYTIFDPVMHPTIALDEFEDV